MPAVNDDLKQVATEIEKIKRDISNIFPTDSHIEMLLS